MTRFIKRGGKIWIRVFPDKPITKKPQETRMGKGKGAPEEWVAVIKPGRILFEMEGVVETDARAGDAPGRGQAADRDPVRHPLRAGACVVTKMTKTAELRDLSVEDLRAKAKELDDQGFRLRLQKAMGQLESPIRLRTTRREVARIKTIIRQKEQA